MCGPNSLYMLLALHGVSVDRRRMKEYIPSHREGMSLLELQEASNELGLKTEVRQCSIDELRRVFDSPVLAYLHKDSHYVVVIAMTDESVTVLDGTTGERSAFSTQELSEVWSGYVLMPEGEDSSMRFLLALPLLGPVVIGLLVSLRRTGGRPPE
jgi:ABC-type bacteriocin/lantibiotic exporter with double-glycine peptidase domain